MSAECYDLQRFVDAQDRGGSHELALAELRAGRKHGHWIWYVFPQIDGLGSSETARLYAISSLEEAGAYLRHPVLGPRLAQAAEAILEQPLRDPQAVLGELDAMKLRSSMTLFARVPGAAAVFGQVLDEFYGGAPDPATVRLLG